MWFNTNKFVNCLSLKNQKSENLPSNIAEFFPNLIALEWTNTSLQTLSFNDMQQFSKLQVFIASGNEISNLDSDVFSSTRHLKSINFNDNLLTSIGTNLLSDLDDLTMVEFLNNPCVNATTSSRQAVRNLDQKLPTFCSSSKTTSGKKTIIIFFP